VADLGETKPEQLGETNNPTVDSPKELGETHSDGSQNRGTGFTLGLVEGQVKSDIDLIRNAAARHARFPIPEETRRKAAEWLAEVASGKRYDGRARVNAVKALADLERINMEAELQAATGGVTRVDITSGGKPLVPDAKALSDAELAERIKALESGG
jgi:hypothetical protein